MVNEITPTYYAGNTTAQEYTIKGNGFLLIPEDAVGALSYYNANPTRFAGDGNILHQYDVEVLNDNLMRLTRRSQEVVANASYIGCITNADASEIYWTNNTAPLP